MEAIKKNCYRYTLCIGFLMIMTGQASNGQALPPLQPEQDACGALTICGGYFKTSYSYSGYGKIREQQLKWSSSGYILPNPGHTESNSVWIKLEITTAGTIIFTIKPVNPANDYDFTIYNLTGQSCTGPLDETTRIRSNGNQPKGSDGSVGLDLLSPLDFVQASTVGSSFLRYVQANAGDVYYLLIDNASASASGFSIDFAGSTAKFKSAPTPSYGSILTGCDFNSRGTTVHMSDPVLCSSVAPDGSDFKIVPALADVISASGINCNGANGYSRDILLQFSKPLPQGTYTLTAATGTDGNTLFNLCSDGQLAGDGIAFTVTDALEIDAGNDTSICTGALLPINASISGGMNNQVLWTPDAYLDNASANDPVVTPKKDIAYILTVIPAGRTECAQKDTLTIKVLKGFNMLNKDTSVCRGIPVMLNVDADRRYTYTWSPALNATSALFPSVTATPDVTTTYQLTASYPGCEDSIQSITIRVNNAPHIDLGADTTVCQGNRVMLKPVVPLTGNNSYNWLPKDLFNDNQQPQVSYKAVTMETILLTLTTPEGCTSKAGRTIFVSPNPRVEAGSNRVVLAGEQVILSGEVDDRTARLKWTPAAAFINDTVARTSVTALVDQTYFLTAVNSHQCSSYDSVFIKIYHKIIVPNAFSPNGDGINETWNIEHLADYKNCHIQVFNRYGQSIYQSTGYNRPWDGTVHGSVIQFGVYYYIIRLNDHDTPPVTGSLTIVR